MLLGRFQFSKLRRFSAAAASERALTPREVVESLDKYIVGQSQGKRAVAIAYRNRWRRNQLTPDLQKEVISDESVIKLLFEFFLRLFQKIY